MIEPVFSIPAAGKAHVQATTTGEWETASRLASGQDAEAFLGRVGSDRPRAVGIELLWEGPPLSFVGTRLEGDRVGALSELVEVLVAPDLQSHEALAALSGGDLGPVAVAECGAVNAWLSVGAATLWDGATWTEPSELLAVRPDLQVCAHPVALEVGHRNAWYAVQVSTQTDRGHVIDQALLTRLAGLVKDRTEE